MLDDDSSTICISHPSPALKPTHERTHTYTKLSFACKYLFASWMRLEGIDYRPHKVVIVDDEY